MFAELYTRLGGPSRGNYDYRVELAAVIIIPQQSYIAQTILAYNTVIIIIGNLVFKRC